MTMWIESFEEENPQRFTSRAIKVLRTARDYATRRRHSVVTPEHVLWALTAFDTGLSRRALEQLGIDVTENVNELELLIEIPSEAHDVVPAIDPETERMLKEAKAQSNLLNHSWIGTEHLVMGILKCDCPAADYFQERGVELIRYQEVVSSYFSHPEGTRGSYTCPDTALKDRKPFL